MPFLFLPLLVLILVVLFKCIRIVPQANEYVIEFLGSYSKTLGNGLHFLVPFVERVSNKVSLKEQVEDFPPQPVITKDNVTMQIDTVVYFTIFNSELFTYGVEHPIMALANLTATTLRNIIGALELDQTLTSRDIINSKMQATLDEATDKWGIKVNRVELKNILPPKDIQASMEKQMKAERERRQTLLESEAHKESVVLRADGDKQAMILRAEAERDAAIARATGEAESIRLVYEAEAEGLRKLSEVGVSQSVLTLKKLDALKALGDGRATKIVVPTDLAGTASDLTFKSEVLGLGDKADSSPKSVPQPPAPDTCCDDEERSGVTRSFVSEERLIGEVHGDGAPPRQTGEGPRSTPPRQASQFQQRRRQAPEQ